MNHQEFKSAIAQIKYERGYNGISFAHRALSTAQMGILAEAITLNPEITSVALDSCHIQDEGVATFVEILQASGHCLKELCMPNNCIGVTGAEALAKLRVGVLSLKNNIGIGDAGAKALARGRFVCLNLSATGITDEGAQALAGNLFLEALNLSYNFITEKGGEALSSNRFFKKVKLKGCKMSDEAITRYEDRSPKPLQRSAAPKRWRSLWCCFYPKRDAQTARDTQTAATDVAPQPMIRVSVV